MEPIETGNTPTQGPETGAAPESQWPGLWDDLANVKALADMAMGHPQTSRLAMAVAGLCQVVENLAQRVEALESPKPCEGCEEGAELDRLSASLDRLDAESPPKTRGALRSALVELGILKGGD